MTSQHVELAFQKAQELVESVASQLPSELMSHTLLESVFNAFVHCDDNAQPQSEKAKGASA